jgi:hypothetical protein
MHYFLNTCSKVTERNSVFAKERSLSEILVLINASFAFRYTRRCPISIFLSILLSINQRSSQCLARSKAYRINPGTSYAHVKVRAGMNAACAADRFYANLACNVITNPHQHKIFSPPPRNINFDAQSF